MFILDELPMDQGWAFYSWDIENDGWLAFNGVRRDDLGYVAREAKRLLAKSQAARKSPYKQSGTKN